MASISEKQVTTDRHFLPVHEDSLAVSLGGTDGHLCPWKPDSDDQNYANQCGHVTQYPHIYIKSVYFSIF